MKRHIALLSGLCLASTIAIAGEYDEHPQAQPPTPGQWQQPGDHSAEGDPRAADVVATDAVGKTVVDAEGEKVGEIENVIAGEFGSEAMAVIKTDGVLGIGDKELHVPLSQFLLTDDEDELKSALTKDELIAHHAVESDSEQEEAE